MCETAFYKLLGGNVPNCVVRIEGQFKAAIRSIFPSDLDESGLHINLDVALVPEPEGPGGTGSVSVRVGEKTIAYLPDQHALAWAGPIRRVVASGLLPTTTARLFAIETKGSGRSDFLLSIRLYLGDPIEGLPFNGPPTEQYTMLARGPHVKLAKVDEHLAELLRIVPASRHGICFATLRERPPVGGKGKPLVDVLIDQSRVGQLTPQMSQRYLPMIRHFQKRGLITSCYADIAASAVDAQVRIHAVKANEVDDQFLNGAPVTLPRLTIETEDPLAYNLTPMADHLKPRPLPTQVKQVDDRPTGSSTNNREMGNSTFKLVKVSTTDSSERIELLTQNLRERSAADPPAELAAMITDLSCQYEESFSIDRIADAYGAVITIDCSEPELLSALFKATKEYAVAAYDSVLQRLYSPHGSASVSVILGGAVVIPYVNAQLLDHLVRNPTWPDPESPFVIIERDDSGDEENYIQMYLNDDGSYQLEYREGSFERHFGFETTDPQLVSAAMWAWVTLDYHRFQTIVAWERVELDS